jgi:hypothetical protein
MIGPAALSLHIARFLQTDAQVQCSPARWQLLPDLEKLTFADACAALDACRKPVIFAPLAEPGAVFVLPAADVGPQVQGTWMWHHANQNANLPRFLDRERAAPGDVLAFGRMDDVIETTIETLQFWTRDYLVPAAITLHADTTRAHAHWLVIRHGHFEWSHGWSCKIA